MGMRNVIAIIIIIVISGCATTEEILAKKKEDDRLKNDNFQIICKSNGYEISTHAFKNCIQDLRNEDIKAQLKEKKRISELRKARSSRQQNYKTGPLHEDLHRELERTRSSNCINNRGYVRNCRPGF